MYIDFKESIILLMQHPIMHRSMTTLSHEELSQAYDLIMNLQHWSNDEEYTMLDYIQMARLSYSLGELAYLMADDENVVIGHYRDAVKFLIQGGFDMSVVKWTQLVSLRSIEE